MSFRRRPIVMVLLASMMSLLATAVAVQPAAASPHAPIHLARIPADNTWHTRKFTMQSRLVSSRLAKKEGCTQPARVRFSLRVRGKSNGYDLAFFKMTNQGTYTMSSGKLDGDTYQWRPTPELKVNETEEVYDWATGVPYHFGSRPWGQSAFIITVIPTGKSSACAFEFIVGAAKAGQPQAEAIAGPTASANGSFENAFQHDSTAAFTSDPTGAGSDWDAGMAPGTSPSIAAVPGGYEIALQTNTNDLWLLGTYGDIDTHLGMMPGTSPSIHLLPDGGYEVAFQANTGDLWVYGTSWTGDTGQGMAAGTSPSLTAINSSYEVAFQANTHDLYTWNNLTGPANLGYGMMPGTSPAITGLWIGGAEIAFQANTGHLWVTGNAGSGDTGLGMDFASSPSIVVSGGGYEVAFNAFSSNDLWVYGSDGTADQHLGMMPGTSPAIGSVSSGRAAYEIAFQANDGKLWNTGADGTGGNILDMAPGTSPAITSV